MVENPAKANSPQKISNGQGRFSKIFVTEDGLEHNLKNKNLKSALKISLNKISQRQGDKNQHENYSVYEKIYDSVKQTTTYSLSLNVYSEKNPFYLKNIITVKDGKEKFGFLKIIPNSKPKDKEEVLNNLSGVIQILDSEMNIRSQTEFVNGIPQNVNSKSPNSNYSRVYCRETFEVVAHGCALEPNHMPGIPCVAEGGQRAYYELVSTGQSCFGTSGEEDNYISAPDQPTIGSSGGGGANLLVKLFEDPNFLHTNFLLGANKMDLLNLTAKYIFINDPDSSGVYNQINGSVITQLNQILSIFENSNNNLFSDFDNLQDLLDNLRFYFQGEGYHYDYRIYNLINYLFEHPTQENADFVAWATQFFIDNTSQNGICPVSWEKFQNWFMVVAEGIDDQYDSTFWDNPNLTFPRQDLPTFLAYNNAFPHHPDGTGMSADEVFDLVGGLMKSNHYSQNALVKSQWSNACAIRVSRALNYSGIIIPTVSGTYKGSDGKNYFVNAKALNKFMRETFGVSPINPDHHHFTSWQSLILFYRISTNFMKQGIFSMVSSDPSWASGHADEIKFDATCVNSCHFEGPIEYIDIWLLK